MHLQIERTIIERGPFEFDIWADMNMNDIDKIIDKLPDYENSTALAAWDRGLRILNSVLLFGINLELLLTSVPKSDSETFTKVAWQWNC